MNGIQRIQTQMAEKKAFVAYLTVGDGGVQRSLEAALALIDAGVTMLELGVPFSDPIADGPVIQRAAARALAQGTSLHDVLWLATEIRKRSDIALILFSYLNPILSAMETDFFKRAQQAGIDGILLVDAPIEASTEIHQQCLANGIAPIYVVTPSTPAHRIRMIDDYGKGFLYYACRKGTTGVRSDLPDDFVTMIQNIKEHSVLPVVTGFGIATRDAAERVLQYSDGVVVGSLFVKALEDGMSPSELGRLALRINPLR